MNPSEGWGVSVEPGVWVGCGVSVCPGLSLGRAVGVGPGARDGDSDGRSPDGVSDGPLELDGNAGVGVVLGSGDLVGSGLTVGSTDGLGVGTSGTGVGAPG